MAVIGYAFEGSWIIFAPILLGAQSPLQSWCTAKPEVSRTRVRRVLRARVHAVAVAVGLVAHV
jgi:hypothetical protein